MSMWRTSRKHHLSVLVVFTSALCATGCSDKSQATIEDHEAYASRVADLGGTLRIHLEFAGSDVTDDQLASLAFPESVWSINLSGTSISDRGAQELIRAKNLEHANLKDTQLSDASEDIFRQMEKLWRVNVDCPNVSRAGFNRIYLHARSLEFPGKTIYSQIPRLSPVNSEKN